MLALYTFLSRKAKILRPCAFGERYESSQPNSWRLVEHFKSQAQKLIDPCFLEIRNFWHVWPLRAPGKNNVPELISNPPG